MTDDDAEKIIERLKFTKKELETKRQKDFQDKVMQMMILNIAEDIDNRINKTTWQTTQSISQNVTKREDGPSTSQHSVDSILIHLEKYITNPSITCPKVEYLQDLNTELKELTFSEKMIPTSTTNGACIPLVTQTEIFKNATNPNPWYTGGIGKIQFS